MARRSGKSSKVALGYPSGFVSVLSNTDSPTFPATSQGLRSGLVPASFGAVSDEKQTSARPGVRVEQLLCVLLALAKERRRLHVLLGVDFITSSLLTNCKLWLFSVMQDGVILSDTRLPNF